MFIHIASRWYMGIALEVHPHGLALVYGQEDAAAGHPLGRESCPEVVHAREREAAELWRQCERAAVIVRLLTLTLRIRRLLLHWQRRRRRCRSVASPRVNANRST